jgi:alanyl-tRNA synthetase
MMKYKSVSEIRNLYLQYFQEKGHALVPSASLIPSGDPTLLFTTAGMVQFKPYFTGAVELPYTRATSAQKCLRTTDLENVGQTERHCTFFEMLGNFSFGDYFKKEAIRYALEFSVKYLEIPKDKIWITIFENDDEAKAMWMDEGVPEDRIVRLGKKDNFWGPAGDSGACGPCSELYLDRGIEKGFPGCGTKASCKPGCDCDRFMEYWNLVFNQFNQTVEGELQPLKQTGIDTGAGVERIALLLQEVDSVYDTDEFQYILKSIQDIAKTDYTNDTKIPFRVIADHARSVFFAIGDSIYPDKTGRGYVIRRLIRRAALFARKIGVKDPFLFRLVPVLAKIYGHRYPELQSKETEISKILKSEEELFAHTLELGLDELERIIEKLLAKGDSKIAGEDSFRLYGTFGFPKEMTKELVLERGLEFDEAEFDRELEKDRVLSRESWKGKKISFLTGLDSSELKPTEFLGYQQTSGTGKVQFIFTPEGKPVTQIGIGEKAVLVLDRTPFYAESGGQIGDTGFLRSDTMLFQIQDVQKENDSFLHIGVLLKGELKIGDQLTAEIESSRRKRLAAHHSGTHLMHGALRSILGDHVRQKASLVSDEYLRFDFSHPNPLSEKEIKSIEEYVNTSILNKIPVETKILPIEEAKSSGAIAFFEEKYGDFVRIVEMGEKSREFCGGTHVSNTQEIGAFYILKESSPGAGNRRIEAVCGAAVLENFTEKFRELDEKIQTFNLKAKGILGESDLIQTPVPSPDSIEKKFQEKGAGAVQEFRDLLNFLNQKWEEKSQKLFKESKKKEAESFQNNPEIIEELTRSQETIGQFSVITKVFPGADTKALKELGDVFKSRIPNVVILFGSVQDDTASLVFLCNQASTQNGIHCGNLLKDSVAILGGKGGGRPDSAQGGGKEVGKIEEAIQLAKSKIPR